MNAMHKMVVLLFCSAGVVAFAPHTATNTEGGIRRHTRLVKSSPAEHDTLTKSPQAVRLWFSEQVELAVTTVKLADAAGTPIALDPVTRPDTGKDAPVVAGLKKALAAGAYVVAWSTAAKDGHPTKGTIGFVVKASR
jgi:methionine-rich copper-binding protein CopC